MERTRTLLEFRKLLDPRKAVQSDSDDPQIAAAATSCCPAHQQTKVGIESRNNSLRSTGRTHDPIRSGALTRTGAGRPRLKGLQSCDAVRSGSTRRLHSVAPTRRCQTSIRTTCEIALVGALATCGPRSHRRGRGRRPGALSRVVEHLATTTGAARVAQIHRQARRRKHDHRRSAQTRLCKIRRSSPSAASSASSSTPSSRPNACRGEVPKRSPTPGPIDEDYHDSSATSSQ